MNSTTHTAGEDFLASHYNDLRKDVLTRGDYVVATGSSNAFVVALDAQIVAYETGMRVIFKANHTITASPTINVNSIGAKTIVDQDLSGIRAGITSTKIYELVYNGTNFVLLNKDKETFYSRGDGSDGTVVFDGAATILGMVPSGSVYTMTRDIYTVDLTVNTGVSINPAGYAVYSTGTMTLTGTAKILRNGNNGSGATGGTALATGTVGVSLGGSNGGAGVIGAGNVGIASTAVSPSYATTSTGSSVGGTGGNGGTPGAAGGTTAVATQGILYNTALDLGKILAYFISPSRGFLNTAAYGALPNGTGGGSGGGGSGATGGTGGGAGGNGGTIFIYANVIAGSGTIESIGGIGANGTAGSGGFAGGGGGGAGGSGGIVVIMYNSGTPWTCTLTGGTAGSGGAGASGGTSGASGATGTAGQSILINV